MDNSGKKKNNYSPQKGQKQKSHDGICNMGTFIQSMKVSTSTTYWNKNCKTEQVTSIKYQQCQNLGGVQVATNVANPKL